MARKAPIPPIIGVPPEIAAILQPLKDLVEQIDKDLNSEVNKTNGIAQALIEGNYVSGGATGYIPVIPADTEEPDYTQPDAVTGLSATPMMKAIFLEWDDPTDQLGDESGEKIFAYTEIWRAIKTLPTDPDPAIGDAIKIGETTSWVYTDHLGSYGVHAFYWVRTMSIWDVLGPWNAAAGTDAQTGTINGVDLTDEIITAAKIADNTIDDGKMLSVDWGKVLTRPEDAELLNIWQNWSDIIDDNGKMADDYADRTILNTAADFLGRGNFATLNQITATNVGTYVGGLAIKNAYIGNGAITEAKMGSLSVARAAIQNGAVDTLQIADAAITDAKVDSMSAARITFGTMDGDRIAVNSLDGDRIVANAITATHVGTNQIIANAANIGDAVITGAKIGDLQVDTIKVANNAITVGASYFNSASNGVNNSNFETFASLAINPQGSPVYMTFTLKINCASFSASNQTRYLYARILRGSTVVWGGDVVVASVRSIDYTASEPLQEILTFGYRDTSGLSTTYYLQLQSPSAGSFYYGSHRSGFALATKK